MKTVSKSDRLQVAFVGAGDISFRHANVLKTIPQAEIAAVCDIAPTRARDFALKYSTKQTYSFVAEMLRQVRPNIVHILTPPQFHAPLALECLRAGSDVLVEKPLAVSITDGEKLRVECMRRGLQCGVNHQFTYTSVFHQLLETVRHCQLGRLDHVAVNFCVPPEHLRLLDSGHFIFQNPVNLIFEFGPHPFSVIHLLMGRVVEAECLASGEQCLSNGKCILNSWQISLVCERGTASLNLLIGKGVRHHFVSVLGEDGVANADLWRQTLQVIRPTPFRFAGPLWTAYANSKANLCSALNGILHHYGAALGSSSSKAYIDPFVASIGAFYKARLEGSSLRDDVNNGNAVVEYCERVARSAKFAPARQEAVANAI